MRTCEQGQASVEWVAAVALVAVLLGGGLGVAMAQAGLLERRVTRGMARAVCVVSAGDCWRDREPCVVASRGDASSWTASVAILRFGRDRLALVERRSDGTYAVTLEGAWKGGAAATGGSPRVKVHLKGIDFSAGAEVTAALLARLGDGRTWVVGSAAEAQAIVEGGGAARAPDVTYDDRAWLSSLGLALGADVFGEGVPVAEGEVAFDQHWGVSTDRRTGRRTASIHASWAARGSLLGDVLGASAGHEGDVIAIESDASGRPVDLRVTTTGRFGGSRDLPAVVQPVAGLLPAGGSDRRYEVTAHLDLTDARNRAAARELLAAIDDKDGRATPAPALRRLLEERGTFEARVVSASATSDDDGASGGVGGVTGGLERHVERVDRHLLGATSRGLDGQWITRTDCVA